MTIYIIRRGGSQQVRLVLRRMAISVPDMSGCAPLVLPLLLLLLLSTHQASGRLVLHGGHRLDEGYEARGGDFDRRNAMLMDSYTSISNYTTAINEKLITFLPGFAGNTTPSAHRAGYVHLKMEMKTMGGNDSQEEDDDNCRTRKGDHDHGNFNNSTSSRAEIKSLFYYFVESERSPSIDPVVLWLNGGPGCSSMYGFALGNGPFRFQKPIDTSSTLPTLSVNPYAWSKVANMIFLDSPFGVGLSLGSVADRYQQQQQPLRTDDRQTALDLHAFLLVWLQAHPAFSSNPLYLAGESYAGVYIPMLAMEIVRGANPVSIDGDRSLQPLLNLKGYLIGNGVAEADEAIGFNAFGAVEASHGLSVINEEMYRWVTSVCGSREIMADIWRAPDLCRHAVRIFGGFFLDFATFNRVDIYNTLGPCDNHLHYYYTVRNAYLSQVFRDLRNNLTTPVDVIGESPPPSGDSMPSPPPSSPPPPLRSRPLSASSGSGSESDESSYYCEDSKWLGDWFNDAQVRTAINVRPVSEIGNWTDCTPEADLVYTRNGGNMVPLHRDLTSKYGLRALIFSGDHDLIVSTATSDAWLRSLGYGEASPGSAMMRRWTLGDRTAGFLQTFEHNLTFATVLGAGHAVPKDKPAEALEFFSAWIARSGSFSQ